MYARNTDILEASPHKSASILSFSFKLLASTDHLFSLAHILSLSFFLVSIASFASFAFTYSSHISILWLPWFLHLIDIQFSISLPVSSYDDYFLLIIIKGMHSIIIIAGHISHIWLLQSIISLYLFISARSDFSLYHSRPSVTGN